MELIPLTKQKQNYLKKYNLVKKFEKQINLLYSNPHHPGLNLEKLEPKELGLYSFRIDRKYRAVFAVNNGFIKIIALTNHYK